jgi:hypothetical protein
MVVDSDKGRCFVAQSDIDVGDLIAIEKPSTIFLCPDKDHLSLLKVAL